MKEYRVRVEIDVSAANPTDAAKAAYYLLRQPDCIPWCCEVFPESDTARSPLLIDLSQVFDPNRRDLPIDDTSGPLSNNEWCSSIEENNDE